MNEDLKRVCKDSPHGRHYWTMTDRWVDREIQTSKNVWKTKFFCAFCLEMKITNSGQGKS